MRRALLLATLALAGCLGAPESGIEPLVVYDQTLTLAHRADDRREPFDVPEGYQELAVTVGGRNGADAGTNARIELLGAAGAPYGNCVCGAGDETATSSWTTGKQASVAGAWSIRIDAEGPTSFHITVHAR